jgi:hypothetical protein
MKYFLLLFFLCIGCSLFGQTVAFSETFESGNSLTLINSAQTNIWFRGSANNCDNSWSLYISNNNSAYQYTVTSAASTVHAYFDAAIPTGATNIQLSFRRKVAGESGYDDLRIWSCVNTTVPSAGTQLTTSGSNRVLLGTIQGQTICATTTYTLPNTIAGTTRRIIFTWRNDNSAGTQPPALIDNISLTYTPLSPPSCATTPTPINGGTNILVNQQLSWSATAGATGYDVYFGTTTTPPIVSTNQAGTTYNPGTLNPNTTYYWRIIPRNSSGSATGCTNWSFTTGLAGCLDAPNGLWPSATFTPTCGSTAQNIVTNAYTGEYSNVNLNNGTTYRFSSSVSTDYVTISNSTGTIILASGLTPLTWKSNTTGTVRYYLHNNTACGSSAVERIKSIQCVETPCINSVSYTVEVMPIQPNPIVTTLCSSGFGQLTNEYSEWNGGTSNTTYITTSSVTTDWVTVTQGTFNGTIVGFGSSPLTWEANSDGKYFVHVNRNRYCEQDGVNCRNITLERVSSLPVTLKSFYGETNGTTNIINWVTSSEKNSHYFMVEYSYDGTVWSILENVLASGNTQSEIKYVTYDNNVNKTKFYRLTQYDVDGSFEVFNPIIINRLNSDKKILKYVNILGQEVNYDSTGGVIFVVYDDGTSVKTIR